jgi:Cytochrome c
LQLKDLLFVLFSLTLLFLLGFEVYHEETPEWEKYQREFYQLQAKRLGNEKMAGTPLEIRQIWNKELDRADRCMTCHMGIDKASYADAPQPLTAHPGLDGFMRKHPFNKFGCTICHNGDGRATRYNRTHGFVSHLEYQPLAGPYVQASCTRCHLELYAQNVEFSETPEFNLGKRLTVELGCGACHTIRQMGFLSTVAPELSDFGSKTELAFDLLHDFTYHNLKGEHSMRNWEFEHFKNPQKIMPGNPAQNIPTAIMPNYGLTDEEAESLTIFVMSLKNRKVENIPFGYMPKITNHEDFSQYQ